MYVCLQMVVSCAFRAEAVEPSGSTKGGGGMITRRTIGRRPKQRPQPFHMQAQPSRSTKGEGEVTKWGDTIGGEGRKGGPAGGQPCVCVCIYIYMSTCTYIFLFFAVCICIFFYIYIHMYVN